jgi:dTDP-4-dehydrorhamnose 3,5-epimerase
MMYVPEHFATGFITLEVDCALYYPTTQVYVPGVERGIRYDDPTIGIDWPVEATAVSEKDRLHADLNINDFTH